MQDMATRELLGTATFNLAGIGRVPGAHFLPADDASVLSAKLFGCGIRVLFHVFEGLPVADESMEPLQEGPSSYEPIAEDVDGEAVESHENAEEGRV